MAYFSNGSEGMCFDEQCSKCKYGQMPCPIALVQHEYNYDACNNETARKILDTLVKDNGDCAMFEMAKSDFEVIQEESNENGFLENKIKEFYEQTKLVEFNNIGLGFEIYEKRKGFYFILNNIGFIICGSIEQERFGDFENFEVFHFETGARCTSDISLDVVLNRVKFHSSEGKGKFLESIENMKKELSKKGIEYPVNKLN